MGKLPNTITIENQINDSNNNNNSSEIPYNIKHKFITTNTLKIIKISNIDEPSRTIDELMIGIGYDNFIKFVVDEIIGYNMIYKIKY